MNNPLTSASYYVYIYLDPRKPGIFKYGDYQFDHEPFYVGKGKDNRFKEHLRYLNKYDKNPNKCKIISDILNETKETPIIIFPHQNKSEFESFILEKKLIKIIGRINLDEGPLTNLNNGGYGGDGTKFSDQSKEKLSNQRIGIRNPMYGKSKESNPFYNQKHTLECKKLMSDKRKGTQIGVKNTNWKHVYLVKNITTGVEFQIVNLREFAIVYNLVLTSLKWAFKTGKIHKNWSIRKIN